MDNSSKQEGFKVYVLKQHQHGYVIVELKSGRQLATLPDLVDAVREVRACNREARLLRAA